MKAFKIASLGAAVLAASTFSHTAMAEGAWSANVGLVSQYYFRGIQQTETASASAGVDYENSGFYVGAWTADVDDGLEIDIYGGYGYEFENGLGLSVGYTAYEYTGDFDSAYGEFNFGASFGFLSVDYAVGEWDGVVGDEANTEADYDFLSVTLEHNGFYGTFGTWGKDFEGEYGEVGYGTEVGGFDLGVSYVFSGSDLSDEEALIFSISKTFDL